MEGEGKRAREESTTKKILTQGEGVEHEKEDMRRLLLVLGSDLALDNATENTILLLVRLLPVLERLDGAFHIVIYDHPNV